jgi:ABC-type multidrug transport system fused ATPase/permease subunit
MANNPDVWLGDFQFWTSISTVISLAVIFSIQYLEHTRLRYASGVVLFYWLFFLVAFGIKLRSLISQHIYEKEVPYFVTFCLGFALAGLEFVLESFMPKNASILDAIIDDESPSKSANVFSCLTFSWMSPMMKHGYEQYLTEDDLWNLNEQDTTRVTREKFQDAWEYELENRKHPSIWIALLRGFSGTYFQAALFKTSNDILAFVQPQLLRLLISFVDSYRGDEPQPVIQGTVIALAMFTVSVTQTLCLNQSIQRVFQTGIRIKSAVISAIYAKSLRLSNEGRAAKSTGDIVNLMGVDSQRLLELTNFGQYLWSAPLQIILCMASLYQLLGYSMLAGVIVMIVMIPINGLISRILKNLQQRQMKNKDTRTRLVAEIINNMRSIKLFAWGSTFMNKLEHIRNNLELATLRKIGATQACSSFIWSATPFLVSCTTFAVFVTTQDKPLTTEIVFPALALFHLLSAPLTVIPMVITAITEASVAIDRLTAFFIAEELQPDAIIRKEAVDETGKESVKIRNATFTWDRHGNRNVLEDINFSACKGELTCIIGRVGAGKSSLVQAILGDLYKVNGEVTVHGSIAYVAQQSWVMNTSIRDNITFGYRWDPEFYQQTVKSCALEIDFNQFPDGDQTKVGERGISLSGGQKARVNLARAVYSRADIYILDDCLSAVDQHVGRLLIDNVIGPKGLLKGKTRILATHSIPILMESNFIIYIRDGKIFERGTYTELMATNGEITSLINKANNQGRDENSSQGNDDSAAVAKHNPVLVGGDIRQRNEGISDMEPKKIADTTTRRPSTTTLRRASMMSFPGHRRKLLDSEGAASKTNHGRESSKKGKVAWNVYGEYAKASSLLFVTIYAIMLVGAQTAEIGKLQNLQSVLPTLACHDEISCGHILTTNRRQRLAEAMV